MKVKPFKRFINWIASRRTPETFSKFVKAGELEYAFSSGGQNFYQFKNEQRIPASRALKALDVYDELSLKFDKTYAEILFVAIEEAINNGQIAEVILLTRAARDRIKFVANFDLM